jgi:hypothetical protein
LDQHILATRPLHEDDVARFQLIEDGPNRLSCGAIDVFRGGTQLHRRREAKGEGAGGDEVMAAHI